MIEKIDLMARIEREIERRFEAACERNDWIASVAISPDGVATLFLEKFSEAPVAVGDAEESLRSILAFAREEFGVELKKGADAICRNDECIPNTRAPYHETWRVNVSAAKRIEALAA